MQLKAKAVAIPTSRAVILDSVGLVRRANGHATLRLKLTGPTAELASLRLAEGTRMRVHRRTLSGRP